MKRLMVLLKQYSIQRRKNTATLMQSIFSLILILTLLSTIKYSKPAAAQDASNTEIMIRKVADGVLVNATFQFIDQKSGKKYNSPEEAPADAQLKPESPYNDWCYWNGVLNIAMIRLGQMLDEPAYMVFPSRNIAFNFDHYPYFRDRCKNEGKWVYPFGQHFIMEELDDCGAIGGSLIEVYRKDPQDRYKTYIEKAADHILKKQGRLADGTLVRSFPHQWTLWVDDLYMGIVFLSRMGEFSGESRYFDDAAQQVINYHKYLFNKEKGLMVHCWYSDVQRPGVAFWGRANGWAMVAQVDLLDRLPENHPKRSTLIALLQNHIVGISRYQSGEGLWHQLLDKTDSYLETSCTAMFAYTIARAVNRGYIEPRYASIAKEGWKGVLSKIRPDGQVEGVCTGTGVSDNLIHYYQRPAPLNDVHGIGTVILAGAEMLELLKSGE